MNKFVDLENRLDSVGLLGTPTEYGIGAFTAESGSALTVSGDIAPLGQKRAEEVQYQAVQAPTCRFQDSLNQTNVNIDAILSMGIVYGDYRSFSKISKRGIAGITFDPSQLFIAIIDPQFVRKEKSTTSTENLAESEIVSKVQRGSVSLVERLKSFKSLNAGWDSYGAKPIEWSVINRAIEFVCHVLYDIDSQNKDVVPHPFIAPCSDGSIQFEWSTCYKELTLSIPEKETKPIEYLKADMTSGEEKEEEGEASSINDIVSLVTDWLL